ncbi:MAG: VWA domain-containing protein [Ignavibacteria bacterium]|nr:VWA domain-containing protein [Ignavibacteria bacterium]
MEGMYGHFFDLMEELGFFDHIYETLPADFTAVFEIARVLEDETHPLTALLAPALRLAAPKAGPPQDDAPVNPQVILTEAEECEAGLIRSPQHLPRIYNGQWLLPEEVFYQRLAKKELWVPYPKEPSFFPVDPDEDDFRPDSRKQKLYILLDTSSSMAMRNRISLAKAVVYQVLKRNMKELGDIHLRTFDTRVGALHEARDREGFHALISFIMRLHALGNGTAMARAITQAVHDIGTLPQLAGTEILIITDGACALNETEMRALLGDRIVINTVKIGRTQLYASRSYIRDKLFEDDTVQHRVLSGLQKKEQEFSRLLASAESPNLRRRYEESLRGVRAELNRQVDAMTEQIVVGYGHELERLSALYLPIEDIDIASLLPDSGIHILQLAALFQALSSDIDQAESPDLLRKLSLLDDHIELLLQCTPEGEARDRLRDLQRQVEEKIASMLNRQSDFEHPGVMQHLSAEDRHDIQFLLSASSQMQFSAWSMLFRRLLRRVRSVFRRRGGA